MTTPADPAPARPAPAQAPPITASRARPQLPRQQRRAALTAGAISFLIMQIGAAVLTRAVGTVLVAWAGTIMFGLIGVADSPNGSLGRLVAETNDSYAPSLIRILSTAAAITFVALVVGILLSGFLLRRRGVNHPWGVTWAALAIGGVAASFIDFVPSALIGMLQPGFASAPAAASVAVAAVAVGITIWVAATLAIGALSWWWMAHAMRSRV